jgi:transposase
MSAHEELILLRSIIEQQKAYIQLQETRMAEKDATIADLRKLVDELQSLKANLEETLNEFRRQFFGVSSEKTAAGEQKSDSSPVGETPVEEPKKIEIKSHTRERKPKSRRSDLYANLPVKEVLIPLTDEQRFCDYCNAEMSVIGYTEVREELRITPAVVERIRYIQEVAVCPECKKDGDGTIVKSVVPTALLPHSPASPSAVAYIMYHKTFMGTPYYRQEAGMFQLGLKLPRETMANWYIHCAEDYFYPVYERMHELLLKRDIIHGDETTCQVLREKGKAAESTSYMWIYLSGSDGLPPIVLYDYQPGRGGKYPQSFLEGFTGLFQCDGYQGYNKVEDVILVCCLAHCRRKFYEAVPAERRKKMKLLDIQSAEAIPEPIIPEAEDLPKLIPAEVGLAYCNKLFFIERQLKDLPADDRKERRLELETPVWDSFWNWLDGVTPAGGSKLEKAVNYARNHRETLCNYLLDGRCEISNNAAERRAKSYAIGRKAFLFHTSAAGAGASAVMYSIVETAKANNLNVFQYLYMVLLYMPDYKNEPAGIEMLLPWSDFIKECCSGLIDVENITPEKHNPLPI